MKNYTFTLTPDDMKRQEALETITASAKRARDEAQHVLNRASLNERQMLHRAYEATNPEVKKGTVISFQTSRRAGFRGLETRTYRAVLRMLRLEKWNDNPEIHMTLRWITITQAGKIGQSGQNWEASRAFDAGRYTVVGHWDFDTESFVPKEKE